MPARTKAPRKASRGANGRWIELATEFPLRPIRTDAEAARAVAVIDRLVDLESLTSEEEDYLFVLSDLVVDYEDEHEPDGEVSPAVMLRELIEARGVTQRAVAAAAGVSDATVSAILSGQRLPSRKVMAALAAYFGADPAVFL